MTAVPEPRAAWDRNTEARHAQAAWAAKTVAERVTVLRVARGVLARMAGDLAEAMPTHLSRTAADTLVAEVLPLLEACRFLEREAAGILKTKALGRRGRPFWLGGVESAVERVPVGVVLVIGPGNYPLFLPGVQALQALAAGNAVVWKPGAGGGAVAEVFAAVLDRAGLPGGLLRVTEEGVEAAEAELAAGPDKVVFTGSGGAARAVLAECAKLLIPCVVEASGCDAVVALPGTDGARLVEAMCFGMRLNGSATCMAPRRLLLVGDGQETTILKLRERFATMPGVVVPDATRRQLRNLLEEAKAEGAEVVGDVDAIFVRPVLVVGARPEMRLLRSDVFAPVLTVVQCADEEEALAAERACPFGLTVAIFGEERAARRLGARMQVGTVLVNDVIVPTVDPRVPFGGRRGSGFGVTRGAEGLLEMTAVRTVLVRRGKDVRHYEATTETHRGLFAGLIGLGHGATWQERWTGLRQMISAAKRLK